MSRFSCFIGGLLLLATSVQAAESVGTGLRAGSAKVDITPPTSALNPGDSIRDPLYVRAIVIKNGASCAVLVGADQGNIATPVVSGAIQRVSTTTGCPTGNFIISATHTHSGSTAGIEIAAPTAKQVEDAIVNAVEQANAKLKPARIGYGTNQVYLNVNRDLFEGNMWYQGVNRLGNSDKTLTVVQLLGEDNLPIGVFMNYAMHPINFYMSGVVSADYPGEASRYIEKRYPNTVAVFSQGASGDQNPMLTAPMWKVISLKTRRSWANDASITLPDRWKMWIQQGNSGSPASEEMKKPITAAEGPAYREALSQVGDIAIAEGAIIGESALDVMKNLTPELASTARIWSAQETITCPGRDRLDLSARSGESPPYKDGADVNIKIGLLRIGNIDFATVDGEVYNGIATRLKREAPSNRLMMVTLANGRANSGYIYSNEAGSRLTFQVIGSRLKPDCAEDKIVNGVLRMYSRSAGE